MGVVTAVRVAVLGPRAELGGGGLDDLPDVVVLGATDRLVERGDGETVGMVTPGFCVCERQVSASQEKGEVTLGVGFSNKFGFFSGFDCEMNKKSNTG